MTSNDKRIVKNSVFLLSRTIFLTLVTLYTLREVISILGEKEFGLYTVVFGIVAIFAFINNAMMSATQRFLSIAIGKNKIQEIRNTFYCGLLIHIILAISLTLVIYFLKNYLLNHILNIDGYKDEAIIIYYFAIVSIFVSLLQVPFSALITAYEKMQAFAYIAILEGISKLAVVYLLLFFDYSKVVMYSVFLTSVNILIFLMHIFYCYINFKKVLILVNSEILKIRKMIKEMLNFISWSLIGNLSVVMRNQGANILLNIFFGLATNAAFAIALTIMSAIGALVSSVSNAINPQIFKAYAEGNLKKFYILITYGTKYYIYILSLVVIPSIFFMEYILKLWIGEYPDHTAFFCQLILVVVILDSFSNLLTSGIQADGRIKWNQIVTGTLLCIPLPITFYLYKHNYSIYFIFYVFIFISFLSILTKLYFVNQLTKYNSFKYFIKVLLPCTGVILINSLLMYFVIKIVGKPVRFIELLLCWAIFIFCSSWVVFFCGLNIVEKSKIKFYFKGKFGINKFN
ncbi:MAG: MATE family efflux transporter [Bacilli bacterium]